MGKNNLQKTYKNVKMSLKKNVCLKNLQIYYDFLRPCCGKHFSAFYRRKFYAMKGRIFSFDRNSLQNWKCTRQVMVVIHEFQKSEKVVNKLGIPGCQFTLKFKFYYETPPQLHNKILLLGCLVGLWDSTFLHFSHKINLAPQQLNCIEIKILL